MDLIGTNHPEIATEDSVAVEDFETAMTEVSSSLELVFQVLCEIN